jgi:hypothetical protein
MPEASFYCSYNIYKQILIGSRKPILAIAHKKLHCLRIFYLASQVLEHHHHEALNGSFHEVFDGCCGFSPAASNERKG